MKKNVLIIGNIHKKKGGIHTFLMNFSECLSQNGYAVHFLDIGGNIPKRIWQYFKLFFSNRRIDLFHCQSSSHFGFLPAYVASLAAGFRRTPLVLTHHGQTHNNVFIERSPWVARAMNNVAYVTTPCKATTVPFHRFPVPVQAIPNLFNARALTFIARSELKPRFIWNRVVYRPDLALDAFVQVRKRYPGATLAMYGNVSRCSNVDKYISLPGIEFKGYVDRATMLEEMSGYDVFINTCRNDSFGYAVFEAMALGLSVVSVYSAVIHDYIGDDIVYFTQEDNTDSLAETLLYVLENQGEALARLPLARDMAGSFHCRQILPQWEKVYASVARGGER